jgi:hypothetical protein
MILGAGGHWLYFVTFCCYVDQDIGCQIVKCVYVWTIQKYSVYLFKDQATKEYTNGWIDQRGPDLSSGLLKHTEELQNSWMVEDCYLQRNNNKPPTNFVFGRNRVLSVSFVNSLI